VREPAGSLEYPGANGWTLVPSRSDATGQFVIVGAPPGYGWLTVVDPRTGALRGQYVYLPEDFTPVEVSIDFGDGAEGGY
jgi:hypothetical protein